MGSKSNSSTSSTTEQTDKRIQTGDGGVVVQLEEGSTLSFLDPGTQEILGEGLEYLTGLGSDLISSSTDITLSAQELVGTSQELITNYQEQMQKDSSERIGDQIVKIGIPAVAALGLAYMVMKK